MQRFRFRLQRLLWQRTVREAAAEQALAVAAGAEREAAGVLRSLAESRAAEAAALGVALAETLPGEALVLHARFAAGLARWAESATERLEAARLEAARRREELCQRRRAREVVTQLRAEAWSAYRLAGERVEQMELDEMAGNRHARRRGPAEE
jgi:flagellar export protein FliJ